MYTYIKGEPLKVSGKFEIKFLKKGLKIRFGGYASGSVVVCWKKINIDGVGI